MNLHKALLILTGLGLLLASSCDKAPETDFTYSPTENPEAGDTIRFQSTTENGNSFSWTFGEGGFSSEENPSYIYEQAGSYDVNLTATNDVGEQAKTKTLTINDPTNLGFMIVDSTKINPLPLEGAEVWLYDNLADMEGFEKPMRIEIADADGIVLFTNLDPISYYIWALKEEAGGVWAFGAGVEPLAQNETSLYLVPCDWYADQAKSSRSFANPVLLNLMK